MLSNSQQNKSMRIAFGVILRLVLPLANGVVRGIKGIRDVRFLRVLRSIASSRQALTNLFAFAANTISMNLSSVQGKYGSLSFTFCFAHVLLIMSVKITVSHRIEPILKLLKLRKPNAGIESLPDLPSEALTIPTLTMDDLMASTQTITTGPPMTPPNTPCSPNPSSPIFSPFMRAPRNSLPNFQPNQRKISLEEHMAPNCCTLNILAEPPEGQPIRADIVFIHGLHGSLVNTWKQGLWENDRKPVKFDRPPKPPVRPPKRLRHSRNTVVRPPHKHKRARFAHSDSMQKHSSMDEDMEDNR